MIRHYINTGPHRNFGKPTVTHAHIKDKQTTMFIKNNIYLKLLTAEISLLKWLPSAKYVTPPLDTSISQTQLRACFYFKNIMVSA
jgi:hypothetical protein